MMHQLHLTERWLGLLAALSLLLSVSGFLFLIWRVTRGVQGFVATSIQRLRIEEKIVDLFHDYVELQRLANEQLWSASSSLSPC